MVSPFPGVALLTAPGIDSADGRTGGVQGHQTVLQVLPLGGLGLVLFTMRINNDITVAGDLCGGVEIMKTQRFLHLGYIRGDAVL